MKREEKPNKIYYRIYAESVFIDEYGYCRTYGLKAREKESGNRVLVEIIRDITISRRRAKQMARIFQKYQLAIVHFRDAVESMLIVD